MSASGVPVDLKINLSESMLQKAITLGSGDDIVTIGDALVALPAADEIDGGSGSDKLIIDFLGAITVAPKLSSIETLELHFNGASTLDFSQTSDISSLEFLSGSADVTLRNVPFDISNLRILESQAGAWSIAYEENAGANVNVVWSNNTPAVVALASMNFDEVKSVSLTLDGSNDVSVDALSLDADDTNLVSLTNTNDGNLSISSGAQISTLDALTSISLTSTEGGDVTLGGVSGGFGISESPKLSSITLTASQTGKIELVNIGSSTAAEDLQAISIISRKSRYIYRFRGI